MKVAMWGLGLLALSLFGFLLINIFGNITVTNQLNWTTMKNAVEAAMYDSLDVTQYRLGFCLCSNIPKTNGSWVFNNSNQYKIININDQINDKCINPNDSTGMTCELVEGEYKIDKKIFSESLVRRFAEMVGDNNKDYQLIVQDVIEYPPKVSVMVKSTDKQFLSQGEYTIDNQIDAILESN